MTRLEELRELTDNLLLIPANEQGIGDLQMAMQKALRLIVEELERRDD